jgi:hypothetical protein
MCGLKFVAAAPCIPRAAACVGVAAKVVVEFVSEAVVDAATVVTAAAAGRASGPVENGARADCSIIAATSVQSTLTIAATSTASVQIASRAGVGVGVGVGAGVGAGVGVDFGVGVGVGVVGARSVITWTCVSAGTNRFSRMRSCAASGLQTPMPNPRAHHHNINSSQQIARSKKVSGNRLTFEIATEVVRGNHSVRKEPVLGNFGGRNGIRNGERCGSQSLPLFGAPSQGLHFTCLSARRKNDIDIMILLKLLARGRMLND